MPRAARFCLLFLTLPACAATSVTTTVLPPHRLEQPICPDAVIIHDTPADVPPGGRLLARLRLEGGNLRVTNEKLRHRLQREAARLGANRVLAAEITTPSTLAALAMTIATSYRPGPGAPSPGDPQWAQAATDQNRATETSRPVPTDPTFYGRGLAYAIFVPDDTLRTNLECPEPGSRGQ